MALKRISNELAGVHESINRQHINENFEAIDAALGNAVQLTPTGLTAGGAALTAKQKAVARAGIGVTKLSKLRASIAGARNNNPQVLPPHAPAPTWVAGTLYAARATVRGTGADAANLYFMAGNNAARDTEGTSAAAGSGPSGTLNTLITDNTCRWVYVGPATSPGVLPLYNTATIAASTDVMNGYVHLLPAATFATLGLTSYRPETLGNYGQEAFVSGGLFNARNSGRVNGPNGGTVAAPSYASADERGSIKFHTNSRKWIGLRPAATLVKNRPYEIRVNGRRISESYVSLNADAANSFLLNMGAFPDGEKEVEVMVYDGLRSYIALEIALEAGAAVWPSENPSRVRLTVEGDSISEGAGISGYLPAAWLERVIGDHLGIDAVYNNAVGGTGAINTASATKTTYIERLPDVVAYSPDIHVIGGFHNDSGESGAFTSVARQAAFLTYFQACRSAMPDCTLAVVGTQLLQGESTAAGPTTQYQVEIDAKAAFTAFNDENSLFIPLLTDVRPRVSTANGPHYLVTSAPYNDAHPTPQYYPFIGGYIASKISAWVASQ